MGFPIPAICNNSKCGTVWLATNIAGGDTATVLGSRTGPCPSCRGIGRIPDGQYTNAGGLLFNKSDLDIVLHALQQLQRKAAQGANCEEIANEISASHPVLEPLKKYMPTNAADLTAYLATMTAVASLLLSHCSKEPAPTQNLAPVVNIYVQQGLSEVLTRAHDAHKVNPPDSQEGPQKPSK